MRLDQAREALHAVLLDLANPSVPKAQDDLSKIDRDGDFHMADGVRIDGSSADIVNIPISADDELSDIPAEMRETVAKEITAFRDRSNRRDLERLKREEEMELQERNRMMNGSRNRPSSPPLSAPSGPAGGANGIPVGPRDRTQPPSGPANRGFGGTQIPRDYQKGVAFVNGTATSIDARSAFEDEDTDASDSELEKRRMAKRNAELEKAYLDQERRWLNRERSRTAAVEREKIRDQEEEEHHEEEREAMAKRLREWNDDEELARREEEYYIDRSMWIRNRAAFRAREAAEDDTDRAQEAREHARLNGQRETAGRQADDFLSRQSEEMQLQPQAREPARFKLSLGAAAQKAQANTQSAKRTVAEVEGLLDEEEEEDTGRRELVPIKFDPAAAAADLTEEERAQALKQLAQDIPTSKEGLWDWEVKWEFVDESVIGERLKPFVEKKIVEYLGVQEQMLVDVVEGHLRKKGRPEELVEQLEGVSRSFLGMIRVLLTRYRHLMRRLRCWSRSCGGWLSSSRSLRRKASLRDSLQLDVVNCEEDFHGSSLRASTSPSLAEEVSTFCNCTHNFNP
jgi:PWI domain